MTENEIIESLEELLEASKNYEKTTRDVAYKIKTIPQIELVKMKKSNPKIQELITEYEIIYKRINAEI